MYPPESSSLLSTITEKKGSFFNHSPAECTCKYIAYVETLHTHHKWSTWQMFSHTYTHTHAHRGWRHGRQMKSAQINVQERHSHSERYDIHTYMWKPHIFDSLYIVTCILTSRKKHAHTQTCREMTAFPTLEGKKNTLSIYWLSQYSKNTTRL